MNRPLALMILAQFLAVPGLSPAGEARNWTATVQANGSSLWDVPMVVELEQGPAPGLYAVDAEGSSQVAPAVVFETGGKRRLGLVLDQIDSGATRVLRLRPFQPADRRASGVTLAESGPNVRVLLEGRPWTDYRIDAGPKPILFPVIGPTQQPFTRSYPMVKVEGEDDDHVHQRSFWFTHGAVNGIDFWAEQPGHGSIRETSRRLVRDGGQLGQIQTTDDWLGPDGKRVCRDERSLTFFATRSARILDFEVTVHASDGPVVFGDTKEGSFGLRLASSMDVKRHQGGKITNAEGLTDGDAWGKASPWVDYTGPVEGQTVGVAILNHPDSFRYPTTWHVRDYGLFAANPFGYHDFGRPEPGAHTISAGGSMTLKYRVILHEGSTESARLPTAFEAYARPPRVTVAAE